LRVQVDFFDPEGGFRKVNVHLVPVNRQLL
jgi:hypothetical protein